MNVQGRNERTRKITHGTAERQCLILYSENSELYDTEKSAPENLFKKKHEEKKMLKEYEKCIEMAVGLVSNYA